jgi:diguanylate cyclase (GGDEF)-like protein
MDPDRSCGPADRELCLNRTRLLAARVRSEGLPMSALWIDLDRFSAVNRSFGHRTGDQVLRQIAIRLCHARVDAGELFRVGADEFVLLLCGVDAVGARRLGQQLCRIIDAPIRVGAIALHPTASIGVASLEADELPEGLLERADRAMLEAKARGGNRCLHSGDEPLPGRLGAMLAREELEIESDLHEAMANGGLRLDYQPIVAVDGRIEAIEALMRCQVGERSIPPQKLIAVAEKTGMVARLGEWCLITAAEFARQLQAGGRPLKVAVNVSRLQLADPDFARLVHATLLSSGLEPQYLELELTESLFLDLSSVVQNNIAACVELGVQLAIDDFGTGYSCLANLKDLPAHKLKLDREFTRVLPDDGRAYSVVKMITALGRELGLQVIAEGVETQAQRLSLEAARVHGLQGWLLARPMPAPAALDWLAGAPA